MRTDEDGVIHFSNVPTSTEYQIFLKERTSYLKIYAESSAYDHIIKKAEETHGIAFSLIKAVITVESGFNPTAVSVKGAKGLMQIMPVNYKSLSITDPFHPSQNIMGGALYLKRLFERYGDKPRLVLAAYNAGPRAVDRYKSVPPYRETVNYVQKVMEIYNRHNSS